jgi:hypothetical protein
MRAKITAIATGLLVKGYVRVSVVSSKFSKKERRRQAFKIRRAAALSKLHASGLETL